MFQMIRKCTGLNPDAFERLTLIRHASGSSCIVMLRYMSGFMNAVLKKSRLVQSFYEGNMKEISKVKQKVHFIPCSSIHPLWDDTRTELGTTRSRGVCTPLNMTAGGSFVPSAATPRVTVKLRFSAPHDFTGTVRFPLNSSERVDVSSKRIGVLSILKILNKG